MVTRGSDPEADEPHARQTGVVPTEDELARDAAPKLEGSKSSTTSETATGFSTSKRIFTNEPSIFAF